MKPARTPRPRREPTLGERIHRAIDQEARNRPHKTGWPKARARLRSQR